MKNLICLFLFFIPFIILNSCRNKTVLLLTQKWDCIQVENIVPPNTRFISPEDSANSAKLKLMLETLTWTFKNNMRYECAVNNQVTLEGKYELLDHDKIIVCTSESNKSINRYTIKSLTENELVLSGYAENADVILHFKSN